MGGGEAGRIGRKGRKEGEIDRKEDEGWGCGLKYEVRGGGGAKRGENGVGIKRQIRIR